MPLIRNPSIHSIQWRLKCTIMVSFTYLTFVIFVSVNYIYFSMVVKIQLGYTGLRLRVEQA